ncbi:unnamed protein product [Agarophyton chilense]
MEQAFVSTTPVFRKTLLSRNAVMRSSKRLDLVKPQVPRRPKIVANTPSQPKPSSASETSTEQTETTLIIEADALDPSTGSVVVPATFNLAGAFVFSGGLCFYLGDGWLVAGFPILLLGVLLSVQTFRIRFVFGPTRLSVARKTSDGLKIIRGWKYELITNWEVWWKRVPILAYFKESESYNGRGSIHFFPILCKGDVLLGELRKRTQHLDKTQYN